MSRFPEMSSLFAALASNLQFPDSTVRNEVDVSMSDLNGSLNLCEVPRVGILDTALSLMCFTAPQVYDSTVEFTLKTIVTVLSSSIECKLLRINKEQVLRVGGAISKSDCVDVLENCAVILRKLDGHKGDLCNSLLYAAIRLAALSPGFRQMTPSSCYTGMKFNDPRSSAVANLLGYLPHVSTFGNEEVPLRLLLWHLDPMILKQDISQILQEIMTRPFLSFSMEIYDRMEWRSKLICLVISPSMFIETRALLHNWFLITGLASVMELQIGLAQQVLDVISRPMWWGLSMEVGSKLPFSPAYFPHENHLRRILAGPICHEYFQLLLNNTSGSVSHFSGSSHAVSKKAATKLNAIDHKSMWALVMNFADWFFFPTMLLFCNGSHDNSFQSGSIASSAMPYLMHGAEVSCFTAAASFIAWFLNPIDAPYQDLLVDYLIKVSELWTMKCSNTKRTKATRVHGNDTSRFKLLDKDGTSLHQDNNGAIWSWISDFESLYGKILGPKVQCSNSKTKNLCAHQIQLVRRIPLGILLVHPNLITEAGCSLILHYAAIGTTLMFSDKPNSGQSQRRWKHDRSHGNSDIWVEQYSESEAIAGCRMVFDITDVAKSISPHLFETEEDGLDFVFRLKLKTCNYLLKCIRRLLQFNYNGNGPNGVHTRTDLLARVVRWRHQGKYAFPNNTDLDFICNSLNV